MGKRQRRRERAAAGTAREGASGRRQLGASGPFMVCRECNEPLTPYSRVLADGTEERALYIHPREYLTASEEVAPLQGGYDHEAVPVEGSPATAETTCDFCSEPAPRWVFVPRRPVRVRDVMAAPGANRWLDYSSPWSCCDGCRPAVRSRDIGRMLDRAMSSPHSITAAMPAEERRFYRRFLRGLYARYLKSDPAGPYEVKIRDNPKPLGKRGSLRGA